MLSAMADKEKPARRRRAAASNYWAAYSGPVITAAITVGYSCPPPAYRAVARPTARYRRRAESWPHCCGHDSGGNHAALAA
jgi:hypothetical protein